MPDKTFEVERKDLRNILRNQYSIDFYQRDYKWNKEHMDALLQDLYSSFGREYEKIHSQLSDNGPFYCGDFTSYFLGSFVISVELNSSKIIDGQQRLTSLSIIFLYLLNRISLINDPYKVIRDIEDLISSRHNGGEETNNIDTNDVKIGFSNIKDNIFNKDIIAERYQDVTNYLDELLTDDKKLHYFLYWLREKVLMVEIKTFSTSDAYNIFETMNDRGLNLTNHEMLKGFLLNKVSNLEVSTKKWDSIIDRISLSEIYGDESLLDNIDKFFISVLQGKYGKWVLSNDIVKVNGSRWREINHYHRWIKLNESSIGLKSEKDYENFLDELDFLSKWYVEIHHNNISDQFNLLTNLERPSSKKTLINTMLPVLFSVMYVDDTTKTIKNKITLISKLYDIVKNRRIWDSKPIITSGVNTNLVALLRGKDEQEIAFLCYKYLELDESSCFNYKIVPSYNKSNNRYLKCLLLRIHDIFEESLGKPPLSLSPTNVKNATIEHILSDSPKHKAFFGGDNDNYEFYRNQIGSLLILNSSINSSIQNKFIEDKIKLYLNNNVLASLLSDGLYDDNGKILNNPKLNKLQEKINFKFKPYSQSEGFGPEQIKYRNLMYSLVLKEIFKSESLLDCFNNEFTIEELEDLYEDEIDENIDFFSRSTSGTKKKATTREKLIKIYDTYSINDNNVQLILRVKQKEIEEIEINELGEICYGGNIYINPKRLTDKLKVLSSGWDILYIKYIDDHGIKKEIRLSEARDALY